VPCSRYKKMRSVTNLPQTSSITGALHLLPSQHLEYEQLCALALAGELTDEESTRLRAHLEYCETCHALLGQYGEVVAQVLPAVGAAMHSDTFEEERIPGFDLEAGKCRLLADVEAQDQKRIATEKRSSHSKLIIILLTLGASLTIFAAVPALEKHLRQQAVNQTIPMAQQRDAVVTAQSALKVEPSQPFLSDLELVRLRGQLRRSASTEEDLREQVAQLTDKLQAAERSKSEEAEAKTQLLTQLNSNQNELASLRQSTLLADTARVQMERAEHEKQALQASVAEKDRLIASDRDLLSHDRDIRDLISARNLLIAEIYDVGQDGQRNRPFGRIFYTKDKSLIFYGYDLDKRPGLKKSVAFQAWGNGNNGREVSLGLFYQDDSSKRWVLKFSDPDTLARLRSVFVTVEPLGGSDRPTGKPLLSASLHIDANHP
jgi:hypothetical protein